MNRRHIWRTLCLFAFATVFVVGMGNSTAFSGSLKIFMTDGTSIEVPYYWKQNGEYKFYTSGGVAGIPETQVASVQEILTSKALDPDALDSSRDATPTSPAQAASAGKKKSSSAAGNKISRPMFDFLKDDREVVGSEGGVPIVRLSNLLSSQTRFSPEKLKFRVILYDGDRNKVEARDCVVRKASPDEETVGGITPRGHLYRVEATIKFDSRIKSYEITSVNP